jgi:hypothetical protein
LSHSRFNAAIVDWDDQDFVTAFERAHDQVAAEGLTIHGPKAAARAEALLHEAGYPRARIAVSRTADEAMAHVAHWTVWREAPQS